MALSNKKALTLKTLTKSNVWDVQENDILRMWEAGARESDFKDSADHYLEIIKTAFSVEEIKVDKPEVIQKYEDRGYKTMTLKTSDSEKRLIAIKKKPIQRVTDLTYENINHISAGKLRGSGAKLRRWLGESLTEHSGYHNAWLRHLHDDASHIHAEEEGRHV